MQRSRVRSPSAPPIPYMAGNPGFFFCRYPNFPCFPLEWRRAPVAQWIERPPPKRQVAGSTPVWGTNFNDCCIFKTRLGETGLLEVVNLECVRGDRPLFSGPSFSLKPGGPLHVTGANGSGKTTLLRPLCGLSQPAAGTIRWNGATIHELGDEYRQHFSYVGHSNAIQGELTPEENLRAAACLSGDTEAAPTRQILEHLGLGAHHYFP